MDMRVNESSLNTTEQQEKLETEVSELTQKIDVIFHEVQKILSLSNAQKVQSPHYWNLSTLKLQLDMYLRKRFYKLKILEALTGRDYTSSPFEDLDQQIDALHQESQQYSHLTIEERHKSPNYEILLWLNEWLFKLLYQQIHRYADLEQKDNSLS